MGSIDSLIEIGRQLFDGGRRDVSYQSVWKVLGFSCGELVGVMVGEISCGELLATLSWEDPLGLGGM